MTATPLHLPKQFDCVTEQMCVFYFSKSSGEEDGEINLKLSVEFAGQRVWWREAPSNEIKECVDLTLKYDGKSPIFLRTRWVSLIFYG